MSAPSPLLFESATELARKIRIGEVSSREVVSAHIERVRAVNPKLNAMVRDRFDEALREADRADDVRRHSAPEELPPFHGVPCSIKESFALTGMPNTSGLVSRRHIVSLEDATAVERLRKAGAIPLGVTNTSELCMWMESNNNVYGRTLNAYDDERIAGGSSGGEGAIVGAGGTPFGLGSDVGGSIRMPAFFNGVFGHKPSSGLIPNSGQHPIATNDALLFLGTGPLCRRAEDLMPLVRVLAGPDGRDSRCRTQTLGRVEEVDFRSVEVIDVEDNSWLPVSDELKAAQKAAVRALASLGARVKPARVPALKRSLEIWSSMLHDADDTSFASLLGASGNAALRAKVKEWLLRKSPHTLPALILALIEKVPAAMPKRAEEAVRAGHELREELTRLIGSSGVMLFPSYPTVAPKHNEPLFLPIRWVYPAIFNVMGLPSTQVPLGLNAQGLPLGVQVVGTHGADHRTIAAAIALEQRFGGWLPPRSFGVGNRPSLRPPPPGRGPSYFPANI